MTFDERCYALIRQIPKGKVTTYREIAHALGSRAYRAVGNAMNRNPHPTDLYPCHRVVKSDGSVGGYAKGTEAKIDYLLKEGYDIKGQRLTDFKNILINAEAFTTDKSIS